MADWSPQIDSPTVTRGLGSGGTPATPDSCSIYYLRAASDVFGCEVADDYYSLPEYTRSIIMQAGYVSEEVCIYVCDYMYICMCYVSEEVCIYVIICIYMLLDVYMCVIICIYTCDYMYIYVIICIYICYYMYICVIICIYV